MDAKEAKQIADAFNAYEKEKTLQIQNQNYQKLIKKIRELAENGKYEYTIYVDHISDDHLKELKKLKFNVTPIYKLFDLKVHQYKITWR